MSDRMNCAFVGRCVLNPLVSDRRGASSPEPLATPPVTLALPPTLPSCLKPPVLLPPPTSPIASVCDRPFSPRYSRAEVAAVATESTPPLVSSASAVMSSNWPVPFAPLHFSENGVGKLTQTSSTFVFLSCSQRSARSAGAAAKRRQPSSPYLCDDG